MLFFSLPGKGGIRLGGRLGTACNSTVVRPGREGPAAELAISAGVSALPKGTQMSPCVEPFLSAGSRWDEVPLRGVDGGGGGLF